MMRSMFASVVGMRVHQTRMDVIGNNVANVNTTGFKSARVTFQDLFSQTLRGGSAPAGQFGGTNPIQVGLGSGLASIDTVLTPGTLELTGRATDLAVEGDGFFVMGSGDQLFFTRAGGFSRDAQGYLVGPANGWRVQGWAANPDGTFGVQDRSTLRDLQIPTGQVELAQATTAVKLGQSLDAEAPVGTEHVTSVDVFDSLGQSHTVVIKFRKAATNTWDVGVFEADGTTALTGQTSGAVEGKSGQTDSGGAMNGGMRLSFDTDGKLVPVAAGTPVYGGFQFSPPGGASAMTVALDFSRLTQPVVPGDAVSTVQVIERDGYTMGALESFSFDTRGVIYGIFSNGVRRALGQVALAVFPNVEGLQKAGNNAYVVSANSGLEQIGQPGTGGRGRLAPGNLEMSNVDLAAEFANMIVTQRGFQANSRMITVSDELLQDLVNLKR